MYWAWVTGFGTGKPLDAFNLCRNLSCIDVVRRYLLQMLAIYSENTERERKAARSFRFLLMRFVMRFMMCYMACIVMCGFKREGCKAHAIFTVEEEHLNVLVVFWCLVSFGVTPGVVV